LKWLVNGPENACSSSPYSAYEKLSDGRLRPDRSTVQTASFSVRLPDVLLSSQSDCAPLAGLGELMTRTRPVASEEYVLQAAPSPPDSNPSLITAVPADVGSVP
jgi:hypothetical protein